MFHLTVKIPPSIPVHLRVCLLLPIPKRDSRDTLESSIISFGYLGYTTVVTHMKFY
jgi:hypothetical protein